MRLSSDLREFIGLLNSRGVEYVIVGAYSLAFHGRPRYTGDLDILIRPSPENAEKIAAVLNEFGFSESGFKSSDFIEPDQMIQLGRVPNRIDLMTGISGVETNDAFATKTGRASWASRIYSQQRIAYSKQARRCPAPGSCRP